MKCSVFVLNSCILGANEVEFWNSIFERYRERYHFHFFTTSLHDELKADETIHVVYGATVVEKTSAVASESLRQLIQKVADKDHVWEEYKQNLSQAVAYSWLLFWTIAVRSFTPAKVIIWNGHHVPEAALAEICRLEGVEALFAERGPFAGTFTLDPEGSNCLSSFYRHFSNAPLPATECRLEDFADIYFSAGVSNWGQPDRRSCDEFWAAFRIPEGKLVLFFPTQVDRDTNSKLYSPHFTSSQDALANLVDWCNHHQDEVFLIVKKHPMHEGNHYFDEIEIKSGAFIENAHIFDCIQYCDGIVSVNSSAAVEGALMGKPVLVLGNSLLDHWEHVFKLNDRRAFDATLRTFVNAVKESATFPNKDYFCKLIFGYLYSAKSEHMALGMKTPQLDGPPGPECPAATLEILQQSVCSLDALIPHHQSPLFQLIQRENEVLKLVTQVNCYKNNIFVKILKKLGFLRLPTSSRLRDP